MVLSGSTNAEQRCVSVLLDARSGEHKGVVYESADVLRHRPQVGTSTRSRFLMSG